MSDWNDLVRRGRSATERLGQAKWELGDLADEVETTYNGGQLHNYAEEIGVEYGTLRNYRVVARAFARSRADVRTKASWSVYQMLAGREDRYDILVERERWTVNEMRDRLGLPPQGYRTTDPEHVEHSFTNLEPQDQARLVGDALDDPEVANEVSEKITDYVAADPGLTSRVVAQRNDQVQREVEANANTAEHERHREPDYSAMLEQGVRLINRAKAAEESGRFTPTAEDQAFLYFLAQRIGNPSQPARDDKEALTNSKVDELIADAERYANEAS